LRRRVVWVEVFDIDTGVWGDVSRHS
jgi:hypothetical protein